MLRAVESSSTTVSHRCCFTKKKILIALALILLIGSIVASLRLSPTLGKGSFAITGAVVGLELLALLIYRIKAKQKAPEALDLETERIKYAIAVTVQDARQLKKGGDAYLAIQKTLNNNPDLFLDESTAKDFLYLATPPIHALLTRQNRVSKTEYDGTPDLFSLDGFTCTRSDMLIGHSEIEGWLFKGIYERSQFHNALKGNLYDYLREVFLAEKIQHVITTKQLSMLAVMEKRLIKIPPQTPSDNTSSLSGQNTSSASYTSASFTSSSASGTSDGVFGAQSQAASGERTASTGGLWAEYYVAWRGADTLSPVETINTLKKMSIEERLTLCQQMTTLINETGFVMTTFDNICWSPSLNKFIIVRTKPFGLPINSPEAEIDPAVLKLYASVGFQGWRKECALNQIEA